MSLRAITPQYWTKPQFVSKGLTLARKLDVPREFCLKCVSLQHSGQQGVPHKRAAEILNMTWLGQKFIHVDGKQLQTFATFPGDLEHL